MPKSELPMQPVPFDLSALDDEADAPLASPKRLRTSPPPSVRQPLPPLKRPATSSEAGNAALPPAKAAKRAAAAPPANASCCAAAGAQTIRVDLDRVDRLINLVGELVINQAMLSQSVIENDNNGTSSINMGLEELQQLTREIQDSVMAIRAQPVKPVFQRMSRIVREIADMIGKSVRLDHRG